LKIIAGSASLERPLERPVLTIGNFDGVHLGHRAIMDTVVSRARSLGSVSVVLTFEPHPRKVLQPDRAPALLTTLEQKLERIAATGIDVTIVEPFTLEFARQPAEVFVREYVHRRIRPVEAYLGYDFHYGRDREGSMRLMTELGPRLGFAVTIIPEVVVEGRDVSSTHIRERLAGGDVEGAATLLGRAYDVRGRVRRGERRGQELGFPTANLEPENEILPGAGVYTGRLRLLDAGRPEAGTGFGAVTNVGRRPTFEAAGGLVAEAHLLDFSGDLYGRRVELCFLERLRAERRFESVDALRAQIGRDVAEARRRLSHPG
jgi:riboflavin kinase/FMN adenylyltransferase